MSAPPEVELSVEAEGWSALADAEGLARRACAAALDGAGIDGSGRSVSVLLTSDAEIAKLNARFRGRDGPTNVLSWPAEELSSEADGAAPAPPSPPDGFGDEAESLGDLALAWETVTREAAAMGLAPDHHAFHLMVHGALHLLGYDHERDGDAARMEALEGRICLAAGLRDPYLAEIEGTPRRSAAAGSERSHGR